LVEASGLPRRLDGVVRVHDEEALRGLLAKGLDFGCKPTIIREADGSFSVPVIATEEGLEALRAEGFQLTVNEQPEKPEIGPGDRFEGGRIAPRGFGRKVADPGPGSEPRAS
jgi:hypothetical protein